MQRQFDCFSPSIAQVIDFLTKLYQRNLGYSAINTARSSLSTFITIAEIPVGQHPLVKRFLKGVFNERPALPKYNTTWDAQLMLDYLRTLSPVSKLSLKLLSHKLVMLMLLLSGQRGQTIHLADTRNLEMKNGRITIVIGDIIKTTKPNSHVQPLVFKAYAPDRRLCVYTVMIEYLTRTKDY